MRKFIGLALLFVVSAPAVASPKVLSLRADQARGEAELADGETLEIRLPFVSSRARPRATISAQGLVHGQDCRVLSVENERSGLRVLVQLGATERDSGWNGCTASIDPGLGGDSASLVHVDFGYRIAD